jgi:drug/metabolite transporter (DMT)-like permease
MNARTITLLLFIVALIRGVNFHVAAVALNHLSPISVNTLRFLVGCLPFFILHITSKRKTKLNLETNLKLILFGMIGVFLPNFLFFKGVNEGSILTGAILVALSPVTTIIFSILVLHSRLKNGQWLALVLGCLGAIITLIAGNDGIGNNTLKGNLWFVVFHFVMAFNPVLIKKYFDKVDAFQITRISTGTTFIASFLFAGRQLANSEHLLNAELWLAISYMGLFTTSICFFIWNRGIQVLGPEKVALFLNLVPVFAFISGLFIGNPWNYGQIFGGIIVIIAVFINFHFIKKAKERENTFVKA